MPRFFGVFPTSRTLGRWVARIMAVTVLASLAAPPAGALAETSSAL